MVLSINYGICNRKQLTLGINCSSGEENSFVSGFKMGSVKPQQRTAMSKTQCTSTVADKYTLKSIVGGEIEAENAVEFCLFDI